MLKDPVTDHIAHVVPRLCKIEKDVIPLIVDIFLEYYPTFDLILGPMVDPVLDPENPQEATLNRRVTQENTIASYVVSHMLSLKLTSIHSVSQNYCEKFV